MLTIAFYPSLLPLVSTVLCLFHFTYFFPSLCICHPCSSSVFLPSFSAPLFILLFCPPCLMRHQVGSATLGAALTASSATTCLRVRGPGPSLQTSMKLCITWTGCSRVSLCIQAWRQWMCPLGVTSVIFISASVFVSYLVTLSDLHFTDLMCCFMCFSQKSFIFYNTCIFNFSFFRPCHKILVDFIIR